MRSPIVALVTTISTAALVAAWHLGAQPSGRTLAGIELVAPPSASAAGAPPKQLTTTRKRAKPGPRALTGALVRTPYGTVQVQAVLRGNRISDIRALHLTDANGTSRQISADAAPVLRREALAAQSAQVDVVTGATYTSQGYQLSLQAALDRAHR